MPGTRRVPALHHAVLDDQLHARLAGVVDERGEHLLGVAEVVGDGRPGCARRRCRPWGSRDGRRRRCSGAGARGERPARPGRDRGCCRSRRATRASSPWRSNSAWTSSASFSPKPSAFRWVATNGRSPEVGQAATSRASKRSAAAQAQMSSRLRFGKAGGRGTRASRCDLLVGMVDPAAVAGTSWQDGVGDADGPGAVGEGRQPVDLGAAAGVDRPQGVGDEGVEAVLVALGVAGWDAWRSAPPSGRAWFGSRSTISDGRGRPTQRVSGCSWSKASVAPSVTTSSRSWFLWPAEIWLTTTEPLTPRRCGTAPGPRPRCSTARRRPRRCRRPRPRRRGRGRPACACSGTAVMSSARTRRRGGRR